MDISFLRERNSGVTFSVSDLNGYIKRIFESDRTLTAVSVKGEISNFVYHRSGHLYFSLKDEDSQIRAVMFKSSAQKLKFMPENGMKVILFGSVSVYQKDGSYQLYVSSMEPDGIGALYLAYEKLKEKLSAEGIFSSEYKKEIPVLPERIGVITSPTGAAVRDIINVTGRRYPLAKIYLYPSLVQGDGAEENLIKAIDYFEDSGLVDVIIIGRGGGSIEDLWAFNGEKLARRIFSASTPIISAVGHETDFTICDFVADLRAPTPSAAAEIAVPDTKELLLRLDTAYDRINGALIYTTERKKDKLAKLSESAVYKHPELLFEPHSASLDAIRRELLRLMELKSIDIKTGFKLVIEKINALNPLSVLARGYGILEKEGKIINCVDSLSVGDKITVKLADGDASASVSEITKTRNFK